MATFINPHWLKNIGSAYVCDNTKTSCTACMAHYQKHENKTSAIRTAVVTNVLIEMLLGPKKSVVSGNIWP